VTLQYPELVAHDTLCLFLHTGTSHLLCGIGSMSGTDYGLCSGLFEGRSHYRDYRRQYGQ
jgi:hypothetical protein